ncbi:MAG: nucleotide exchange factor GrpE [Rickettsiales bacterium]|nr:nucleotide exchange factor GrpE [Rickettsiales bacterium]
MSKKHQECQGQCAVENDEINRLNEALDDWKDKYLRLLAEAENTKRRLEIDAKSRAEYNKTAIVKSLLPAMDALALAIGAIKPEVGAETKEGLARVRAAFDAALSENGIERIETVGKPMNPALHKVIAQIEGPGPENEIVEEFQSGYTLDGRPIREAMVATLKKPAAKTAASFAAAGGANPASSADASAAALSTAPPTADGANLASATDTPASFAE